MSSSEDNSDQWISRFCSYLGHEFFAEVSEDFIEDDFNLTGLSSQVPLYKEALEMILDVEPEEDLEDEDEDLEDDDDDDMDLAAEKREARRANRLNHDFNAVEASAELLYGLIHQRFITSRPGITQMHEKYELGHFGVCPRVYCNGARVLPVGISDTPGVETVKLFCPSCLDVYTPPNSRYQAVDGAFFGTTFGCLFLMTFPDLKISSQPPTNVLSPASSSQAAEDASRTTPRSNYLSPTLSGAPTSPSRQSSAAPNAPSEPPTEINGFMTTNFAPGLGKGQIYEPRVYGFKIAEQSKSGPRMQWLRMKPNNIEVLDEGFFYPYAPPTRDGELYDPDSDESMVEDDGDEAGGNGAAIHPDEGQVTRNGDELQERNTAPIRKRPRRTTAEARTAAMPEGMAEVNGEAG